MLMATLWCTQSKHALTMYCVSSSSSWYPVRFSCCWTAAGFLGTALASLRSGLHRVVCSTRGVLSDCRSTGTLSVTWVRLAALIGAFSCCSSFKRAEKVNKMKLSAQMAPDVSIEYVIIKMHKQTDTGKGTHQLPKPRPQYNNPGSKLTLCHKRLGDYI